MISKIDEPFNYKFHGKFDVSKISDHILQYSDEWFVDKERQMSYEVHKETNSIFIYDHTTNWFLGNKYALKVNDSRVIFTNPKTLKEESVDVSRLIRVFVNNQESHKRSVK